MCLTLRVQFKLTPPQASDGGVAGVSGARMGGGERAGGVGGLDRYPSQRTCKADPAESTGRAWKRHILQLQQSTPHK